MNATLDRAELIATEWREDAEKRRALSPNDPAADALEYCATTMLTTLRVAADDDEELSVAAFAELKDKSPSTVRRWCHAGLIGCRVVGREYRIRRGEKCPPTNLRLTPAA